MFCYSGLRTYRINQSISSLLFSTVLILTLAPCKGQAAPAGAAPPAPVNSNFAAAQNSYADVVSHVAAAVVTIRSERRVRAAEQFPFIQDPFFRDFFGVRFRKRNHVTRSNYSADLDPE